MKIKLDNPALIVVDVQKGFDDKDFWGIRNNPECEANIASLVEFWRDNDFPVVFVKHNSQNPNSPLYKSSTGNDFKNFLTGKPDLVVNKSVNSSFLGTPDLNDWLTLHDINQVVICEITTNHCCETTARFAGNLGYETFFVIDATHTFDRKGIDGHIVPADTLSYMTATNLNGEFATVVATEEITNR